MAGIRCAVRRSLLLGLTALAGCTHLGSLDPEDYRATDLGEYAGCFAGDPGPIDPDSLTVTFLGTTSLLFDDGTSQVMIDGFITRPPVHELLRVASDWETIGGVLDDVKASRVRGVFVAHSHYDHALDSAHVAKYTGAPLYGSPSTLNLGHGAGLPVDRLVPIEPGSEVAVGEFGVTVLRSQHSPPDVYNGNLGREIETPLRQPMRASAMVEGGSFDFLIRHGDRTILISPAAGFRAGALHGVRADILFLAVGALGNQPESFREAFYEETVGRVRPRLIVPVHWDSPFRSLWEPLQGTPEAIDNVRNGLDAVIGRARRDGVPVTMLQARQIFSIDDHFAGRAVRGRAAVGGCAGGG